MRFFSEGIKWKRDRGQFISIPLWLRKLIKSTRKNTDKANVNWTRSLGSIWQLVNCISSEVGWNTKPRSSYNFRIGEGPGILFHQYCFPNFHGRHDNTLEEEDWGSWPARALQTRNGSNLGSEIELKSFAAVWELGPGQIFEQLFLPELYENILS